MGVKPTLQITLILQVLKLMPTPPKYLLQRNEIYSLAKGTENAAQITPPLLPLYHIK